MSAVGVKYISPIIIMQASKCDFIASNQHRLQVQLFTRMKRNGTNGF